MRSVRLNDFGKSPLGVRGEGVGGLGSGRCRWRRKKATTEQSLSIAIGEFWDCLRDSLRSNLLGTVTWKREDESTCSISFIVTQRISMRIVLLSYRWNNAEDIVIPVYVQTTLANLGGARDWFTCPLVVNGVACGRRVGKLYLPPGGARYFGCRKCHGLTYRSCQDGTYAHR